MILRNYTIGLASLTLLFSLGCSKSKSDESTAGKSYSSTASSKSSISMKAGTALNIDEGSAAGSTELTTTGPTLCSSVVCFTPKTLTGKYYGTGFLIQSSGNGMVAYFGQDNWSSITGTSQTYSFSTASPQVNTGNLYCCNGTGDLSSPNSYIESAIYLFAYLDATFTVSGVTSNTTMNREFTVRFVFADDAITSAKRGDLMLSDPTDGVFKWMDSSVSAGGNIGNGTLVTTRPANPITMNSSVKNWTNPFGSGQGNQSIPVIYAPLLPASGTGVFQVTETDLKTAGKTYSYAFDPTNFILFPSLLTTDKNSLYSYAQVLTHIHLGGLPHSGQPMGVGNPASTVLTVTGP